MEKLIRALRCSVDAPSNGFECTEDCPYRKLYELEQDNLIYPPDVIIDGIDYYISCDYDRMKLDAADALEKLQKYQWIPTSERLPENESGSEYYDSVIVTLDNGRVAEGCYVDRYEEWWVDAEDGEHYSINATGSVIAWMPFPELYREGDEE